EDLFTQLILGLQTSAFMLLGKVANPANGDIYRNLEEARRTIDILMMLEFKTRGNLSEAESKTLASIVQQLQINYIEEVKKDQGQEIPQDKPN
ncbi:DUF1844 domain-containing protein, partial [Candidatus Woesearchaeota archaeon]|nr:DUF1844 domain-containing protein [Candidatus Woesearchaeota archaeon]